MPVNELNDPSAAENEALRQIAAELKRLNDRLPVPWYSRPIGYGVVGLVFLILATRPGDAAKGFLLISGSLFFVAQSIVGSRLKRWAVTLVVRQYYMSYTVHAESAPDRPPYTLHPVRGVVWAAFLGTPMAAGIVMAINYARVGNKSSARIAALVGVLATVALFSLIFAIPENALDRIPNSVFYIPQLLIVYMIAKSLQSEFIAAHTANGGFVASAWRSVGIGVLCLLLVLGALFGVGFLLEPSYGTVVEFGNDEVYYSGDATEDDARKLAGVLRDIQFFGTGGASVRLESSSGQHTISFVLTNKAWDDPESVDAFKGIGRILSETAFSTPLKIQLCDAYFTSQESFTVK